MKRLLLVTFAFAITIPAVRSADEEQAAIEFIRTRGGNVLTSKKTRRGVPLRPGVEISRVTVDSVCALNGRFDGEDIRKLHSLIDLSHIDFVDSAVVTDEAFKELVAFKSLCSLEINIDSLSEKGFQHLSSFKSFFWLTLTGKKLTEGNAKVLSGIVGLRYLTIRCTSLSEAAFIDIAKCNNLYHLELGCAKMNDENTKAIGSMDKLESLKLVLYPSITSKQLEYLSSMKNLTILDLFITQLKDDDLGAFAKFPKLNDLSIYSSLITDAGLKKFGDLDRLRVLNLGSGRFSSDAVEQLKITLSNCSINSEHTERYGPIPLIRTDGGREIEMPKLKRHRDN